MLAKQWIVGRLGDCDVKRQIGLTDRFIFLDAAQDLPVTFEDRLFLSRRATRSGKAGRLDFQRCTDFQHFEIGRYACLVDNSGRCHLKGWIEHENPCTLPDLDNAIRFERGNGLTNDRAAHLVGFGQLHLARQFLPGRILPARNGVPEACPHF
ncbi:hypothetical protein D3C73_1175400 [compost metagenome]